MKLKKYVNYLIFTLCCICPNKSISHPTGSIISVTGTVLWSYVSPIGDLQHHGCVMMWNRTDGVKTWLVSEHSSSDWIISPKDNKTVYLIERYYDNSDSKHWIRVLKSKVAGLPQEIWPWMEDTHRIGEGGFKMLSDDEMIFASYPNIYQINKGHEPKVWKDISIPILALRPLNDGNILIHSENKVQTIDNDGNLLNSWDKLIEDTPKEELPFFGNRIFDADFVDSNLWIAYWGKRRFDLITEVKKRIIIHQLKTPWLPHGVAYSQQGVFLLASSLDPGNEINPRLWLWNDEELELIWSEKAGIYNKELIK